MKNNEIEQTNARRSFLKKAAYVVPTVIAISQITSPMSAQAAGSKTQLQTGGQETGVTAGIPSTDRGQAMGMFTKRP